jgi:hypothetical protein
MRYSVRATRWAHGWELHIGDLGVTQSRTLDGAPRMACDYIESLTGRHAEVSDIDLYPDLGGLEVQVRQVREKTDRVQRETREAAVESRTVAHSLRRAGLSLSDTAAVLGVSRGRAQQLVQD